MRCEFIRWAPGGSRSPSSSPPVTFPPILPVPPVCPTPFSGPMPVPPLNKKCTITGCGQNRIAPDCASQWCRKHCVALYQGVCPSKKHKKPSAGGATTDLPSSSASPATTSAPLVALPSVVTPALVPLAPPFPMASSVAVLPTEAPDVLPRFSSLLGPAFSDTLARDFELREERRLQEATRIENERRVKQTVKVFAWTLNGQEPTVCHFQSGFIWPFFNISYSVLECVGLIKASDKNSLEYYNDDEYVGYWSRLEVGHVFEVREGHSIFLRSADVSSCPGFKERLAHFRSNAPIFYSQLAREREYVRNNLKTYDTWSIPSSTPQKRKASSSPRVSSSSPSPTPLISSSPDIIELKPKSKLPLPTASNPIPISDDERSTEWPRNFYVCDIVDCFKDCKTSVKRGGKKIRTLKAVFSEHFPGVDFKPSTYHDQRTIWRNAPEHLRRKFLEAGHTTAGTWMSFTAAVRKHNVAQAKSTIVEISD